LPREVVEECELQRVSNTGCERTKRDHTQNCVMYNVMFL
jgi:hypothetical protein